LQKSIEADTLECGAALRCVHVTSGAAGFNLERWFVSNRSLALMCLVALAGCAGPSPEDRALSTPERNRGNATVRAAVYVEAASNVATSATPILASESAFTTKAVAARGKQDKRAAVQPKGKDKPALAPAARQVAAASASVSAGRAIDQKVPVSATGYRFTYAVELDAGGTRTFGFATDQGLLVGDRVLVGDTGVTLVPK